MKCLQIFIIATLLLSGPDAQSLTALVAKSDGVPVLGEARRDALVLKTLKKGESIQADDRAGMFWKTKLPDGSLAYVAVMSVERQVGEESRIQTALRKTALDARGASDRHVEVRTRSSVMGIRGLGESGDIGNAGNLRPDFRAVYAMEGRSVSVKRMIRLDAEVRKEIEEGLHIADRE